MSYQSGERPVDRRASFDLKKQIKGLEDSDATILQAAKDYAVAQDLLRENTMQAYVDNEFDDHTGMLWVSGGYTDVTPTSTAVQGGLMIGSGTANNIAMDDNEIVFRNNGTADLTMFATTFTAGSNFQLTAGTNQLTLTGDPIILDHGNNRNWVMTDWNGSVTYATLKVDTHSGDEYVLLANNGSTYVSCGNATGNVYLRGPQNGSTHQVNVASDRVNINGAVFTPEAYGQALTQSRDVIWNTSGRLGYPTSARRFKKDVEPMELRRAYDLVEGAEPVWYRGTNTVDADDAEGLSFYGFIAEEIAKIDPRYVWFNPEDPEVVDGLDYKRMVVPLLAVVKDLTARIAVLERRGAPNV